MRRLDDWFSRRDFLGLAGGLAFANSALSDVLLPSAASPIGIQLYTLRDLLAKDFEGTLRAVAAIGYREVEFAGLYQRSAREVRTILDRLGLKAPGGHVGIPAITETLDQTIEEARTLGYQYVIVPWIPEESRTADGYRQITETFNRAGEKLRAAGLTLGYHNHWFEFDALAWDPAHCGYDLLLAGTDPKLVVMELDLYWIRKGGKDALTYLKEHPGRFRLVHVKDMGADGGMVDIGQGVIEWPTLLAAARKAGVRHFLVEHDEPKDPLAFARTSYGYIHSLHF